MPRAYPCQAMPWLVACQGLLVSVGPPCLGGESKRKADDGDVSSGSGFRILEDFGSTEGRGGGIPGVA